MSVDTTIAARFWKKVDYKSSTTGCWLWTASKNRAGYGRFGVHRKNRYAHRVAYALTCGGISGRKQVLHRCDNPPCVNPDHLFIGSNSDNRRDMVNKNRHPQGSRHGRAKLTERQVAEIRSSQLSTRKIAARLPIGFRQVSKIRNRKQWRSV